MKSVIYHALRTVSENAYVKCGLGKFGQPSPNKTRETLFEIFQRERFLKSPNKPFLKI